MNRTERGICRFCGQMKMIEITESMGEPTQEQLNELASESCVCEGARKYRERDKIIKAAQTDIDAMLTTTMPEVAAELIDMVPYVFDEKIKKVTMKMPNNVTVNLFKVGRGVKITHESKKKTELLSE